MEIEITAYTIGDAPAYLAEEGLKYAQYYFDVNNLNALQCFKAYQLEPDALLGQHWISACQKANLILMGNRLYDNSLICLEIESTSKHCSKV